MEQRQIAVPVYEALKNDPGYIDLSSLFEKWGRRKAIVDDVHYNPAFNEFLAQYVAERIDIASLNPRPMDYTVATGSPR
jgi:hypothetical protein